MPELPEVEIAARLLRRWCEGRRVVRATALPGSPLRDVTPRVLAKALPGHTVESIDRVGKQLFIHLDRGKVILLHLGMTGKIVRLDPVHQQSARLVLELDDGAAVGLVDPRRFGRVRWLDAHAVSLHPEIAKLGPDALEVTATRGALAARLAGVKSPIKIALLDQRRLAGVGNIYASEALFRARIHPRTPASALDAAAFSRLSRALEHVLRRTLDEDPGDDGLTYLHEGAEVNPFVVYGRSGEPCPRCHTAIERMVQGGRSTFHCPACQVAAIAPSRKGGAATPRARAKRRARRKSE